MLLSIRENEYIYYIARKHFNLLSIQNRRKLNDLLIAKNSVSGKLQMPSLEQSAGLYEKFGVRTFEIYYSSEENYKSKNQPNQ